MTRKASNHTHVPTKVGVAILALLLVGMAFALTLLSQTQDVRSRASTESASKMTGKKCKTSNTCTANEFCSNGRCTALNCPVVAPDSCTVYEIVNHACAVGTKAPGTACKNGSGQPGVCDSNGSCL